MGSSRTYAVSGFRKLHVLPDGGRLASYIVASGAYEGPHPFHDGPALID